MPHDDAGVPEDVRRNGPDTRANEPDLVGGLAAVLDRTLRVLGDAGHKEPACELAAQGWALLRTDHAHAAQRLNGTLHYLTRDRFTGAHGGERDGTREERDEADLPIDVRSLVPARRHELIFETYRALAAGEAFVLINDHDPKPLYYQFAAEHAEQFTWEALESGPEVWRVRIGKTTPSS